MIEQCCGRLVLPEVARRIFGHRPAQRLEQSHDQIVIGADPDVRPVDTATQLVGDRSVEAHDRHSLTSISGPSRPPGDEPRLAGAGGTGHEHSGCIQRREHIEAIARDLVEPRHLAPSLDTRIELDGDRRLQRGQERLYAGLRDRSVLCGQPSDRAQRLAQLGRRPDHVGGRVDAEPADGHLRNVGQGDDVAHEEVGEIDTASLELLHQLVLGVAHLVRRRTHRAVVLLPPTLGTGHDPALHLDEHDVVSARQDDQIDLSVAVRMERNVRDQPPRVVQRRQQQLDHRSLRPRQRAEIEIGREQAGHQLSAR